jgi:predicted AAA+ superfamily ATPase
MAYAGLYDDVMYWAPTQGGTEVDFLLRRGKSFVAVEVKTTANPAPPHFAGLRAIGDLAGIKRRVLVHMGNGPFNTAMGIEALPVLQFAQDGASGRL